MATSRSATDLGSASSGAVTAQGDRPLPARRPAAVLGLGAVLVEWFGFHWDIAYHADIGRDRFRTLPHEMVIAGMALALLVAVFTLTVSGGSIRRGARERPGMALLAASVALTGITLVFDDWTHRQFGVDVAVWSPAHILFGLTMIMAGLGAVLDHAGSPAATDRSLAVCHGGLLTVSTIYLFEYDTGFPHYGLLWLPLATAVLFAFSAASVQASTRSRWVATTVAFTCLLLRAAALGFNSGLGRSLVAPPLGFLAGGLVLDLVMRRSGGKLRPIVARILSWGAMVAVQVPWLRLVGKVWWTPSILVRGILLGGAASALVGWFGSGVGRFIGAARLDRHPGIARPRMRLVLVLTAAIVLGTAVAASAGPVWNQPMPPRRISYSLEHGRARLVIPGSAPSDWVTVVGPKAPIGLFGVGTPPPGPRAVVLFSSFAPDSIAGPRLRAVRSIPLDAPRSWLGGLQWHSGAFEGPVVGTGEYVGLWYLGGDGVWSGAVERGSSGEVVLVQGALTPQVLLRRPLTFRVGVGSGLLLALAEVVLCAVCLARAAWIGSGAAARRPRSR